MNRFKRYEKYKESGIEWLGDIPEHWEIKSLRHFVDYIKNGTSSTQVTESEFMVTRIETISDGIIDVNKIGFVEHFKGIESYRLDKGDILFSHINSLPMVGNCAIYELDIPLYHGMNLLRIKPKTIVYPKWLFYFMKSHFFREYVKSISKHAINQVSVPINKLKSLLLPYIPYVEQKVIANFLDRKTAEIDSLIADKERLIELLQEQRQAIITQAVTKGLDPNVPMKDSGVEWIGEIPEHWLTVAVKRVYDIKLGKMLQPTQNKSDDVLVPYLKALHVQWEKIEVNEYPEMWASPKDIEMFSVKPGDLLICEGGEVGRAAILEDLDRPCIIQNSLHRIRPSVKAKNKYLLYILQIISQKGWLDVLCNKATIAHFTSDKLGNLRIPLPPIEEQEKVIKVIENKAKLLNNYISCEREIIEKLKNYRQSLITAAVTGKIDVRDYYNLRSE